MCAHDVCVDGALLDPNCDPCVQTVCNNNPNCCDVQWTASCVSAAIQDCGASCCGNNVCVGENCDSCAADCGACFCGNDECNNGESCGTCPEDCYDCPTCAHSACTVAGTLNTTECPDACAQEVCAMTPGCCGGPFWSVACQNLAQMLCTGGDPCVTFVCAQMPECCTMTWSQACVDLAKTQCSTQCNCAHSICNVGPGNTPLASDCDPCVTAVCNVDNYCCTTDWDGICVDEVKHICFIHCN
jgi:hypothetical protein